MLKIYALIPVQVGKPSIEAGLPVMMPLKLLQCAHAFDFVCDPEWTFVSESVSPFWRSSKLDDS